jgi:putative transcriptional regulator
MVGMDGLGGHLLIAGSSLLDPNFRRTVVLIGHHDEEGAVGVVLNRESEVEVAAAVPGASAVV